MKISNTKIYVRLGLIALVVASFVFIHNPPLIHAQDATLNQNTNSSDEIADLNQQIADKKKQLEDLQSQSAALQSAVDQAAGQVHDIQSQISLIDAQVAQTNFAINTKQQEISTLELEMTSIQKSIDDRTAEMNVKKKQLAEAIRQLDSNSRVSTLALIITQNNFAEFYGQAQAITTLSDNLKDGIQTVGVLRDELQAKQDALTKARDDYRQSKLQLEIQRDSVVDQRNLKDQLLDGATQTQEKYQDLLNQAAREEQQANSTISALEKQAQDKLNGNTNGGSEPVYSSKGFIWPVKGPITAYFHDPSYPFQKYIGPHTGLDVGVAQGTPIRATADGTVLVANAPNFVFNTAGQKIKSALNYVSIDHGKGIASRYLHLSAVYVRSMQFVHQGEIIGLSGGLPGTAGAGTTTTGAHLHFEIRVNGLPDDPQSYLP